MRFHLVVNPVAGRRRARALSARVVERLRAEGHEATSHETTAPGDARDHVAHLDDDACDRLVVAGGDGTLREVVNARPPPLPWPVAMMPVGTANLVSREVAFPLSNDAEVLAKSLLVSEPWPVSLMELVREGAAPEHAVASVGAGLDGELVHRVAEVRAGERLGGTGGYRQWIGPIWNAFRRYGFPRVEVTVDGRRTYRGTAVVAQNACAYGGIFCLSPEARLDAGTFQVVVVRSRTRRDLLRLFVGAWRGRLADYHDLTILPAHAVEIRGRTPVAVQADGDPSGTTDVSIRVLPRALTLLRVRKSVPSVPGTGTTYSLRE